MPASAWVHWRAGSIFLNTFETLTAILKKRFPVTPSVKQTSFQSDEAQRNSLRLPYIVSLWILRSFCTLVHPIPKIALSKLRRLLCEGAPSIGDGSMCPGHNWETATRLAECVGSGICMCDVCGMGGRRDVGSTVASPMTPSGAVSHNTDACVLPCRALYASCD